MSGIDGHGQQAAHLEFARWRQIGPRCRRRRHGCGGRQGGPGLHAGQRRRRSGSRRRKLVPILELAHDRADCVLFRASGRAGHTIGTGRRRRGGESPLLVLGITHELPERVGRIDRIQVEYETIAVVADRRKREHLRRDVFLEVEHHPHHARAVLSHAHGLNIGIVRRDLRHEFAQRRRQVEPVDVDHEAVRVADHLVHGHQALVGLNGHPRVILGRPHAHRDNAGAKGDLRPGDGQYDRTGTDFQRLRHPFAAGLQQSVGSIGSVGCESLDQHAFSRVSPVGV